MFTQPPGPRLTLVSRLTLRRNFSGYLYQLARHYGDVVQVPVGRSLYLVNHPDFIHEVLITHADHFSAEHSPLDRPTPPNEPLEMARHWLKQQSDRGTPITDRLVYARQILAETLRLYPPIKIIRRHALGAYEIGGYTLPANTSIVISPWVMQHDPRYYPDPFRFDPLRWTSAAEATRPAFAYFPYGAVWCEDAWQTTLTQIVELV